MAALAAVLRLVGAGNGIVAGDDLYGGTSRLLAQVAPNLGIDVTNVDTTNTKYALIMVCLNVLAALQFGKLLLASRCC